MVLFTCLNFVIIIYELQCVFTELLIYGCLNLFLRVTWKSASYVVMIA